MKPKPSLSYCYFQGFGSQPGGENFRRHFHWAEVFDLPVSISELYYYFFNEIPSLTTTTEAVNPQEEK